MAIIGRDRKYFTQDEVDIFNSVLASNKDTKQVNLSGRGLTYTMALQIIKAITKHHNIERLDLSNNLLTKDNRPVTRDELIALSKINTKLELKLPETLGQVLGVSASLDESEACLSY